MRTHLLHALDPAGLHVVECWAGLQGVYRRMAPRIALIGPQRRPLPRLYRGSMHFHMHAMYIRSAVSDRGAAGYSRTCISRIEHVPTCAVMHRAGFHATGGVAGPSAQLPFDNGFPPGAIGHPGSGGASDVSLDMHDLLERISIETSDSVRDLESLIGSGNLDSM